jgi:hypothetical protein
MLGPHLSSRWRASADAHADCAYIQIGSNARPAVDNSFWMSTTCDHPLGFLCSYSPTTPAAPPAVPFVYRSGEREYCTLRGEICGFCLSYLLP